MYFDYNYWEDIISQNASVLIKIKENKKPNRCD
jgi:hypothetical protein